MSQADGTSILLLETNKSRQRHLVGSSANGPTVSVDTCISEIAIFTYNFARHSHIRIPCREDVDDSGTGDVECNEEGSLPMTSTKCVQANTLPAS